MFSKNRFSVIYNISGTKEEARKKAEDICFEQTVELPENLVPKGFIRNDIVGRIESFSKKKETYETKISFSIDIIGSEITQMLNVIFGNISIKPGIYVSKIKFHSALLKYFKGPRFGINGLREILGIKKRPILCTALKPIGFSVPELSDLAYKFALGGIDIIKDDHGIANQDFAKFEQRVKACSEAIKKANEKTKEKSIYVANITAPFDEIVARAKTAKKLGARGLLISPGIVGLDTMRYLSENREISLPIFSHPSFQGTYVLNNKSGISHYVLFAQLPRICGADSIIYPNFGGRFSFTQQECRNIAQGTQVNMKHIKKIFPCPAGGMNLKIIPSLIKFYGQDVIFLIGGGLLNFGPDIISNCRYLRNLVVSS